MEQTINTMFRLYKTRSFGDRFDVTFSYIRENFRTLLKYITYLLLPVSLVQGVAMNGYMDGAMGMQGGDAGDQLVELMTSMGGLMLCSIVGGLLLTALVYALMYIYETRANRLQGLTGSELKPRLVHNLKRVVAVIAVGFVLMAVVGLLTFAVSTLSGWLVALVMVAMMVVAIPMAFLMPIHLMEDLPVLESLRKAFRLGMPTWFGTLGLFIVLVLLMSIVEGLLSMPYYIVVGVKAYLGMQGDGSGVADSVGFSFLLYLLGVAQSYMNYLVSSVLLIALGFQYGHAAEKIDHVSMEQTIDHFEQL